jgi:hypothetical protein
VLLDREPIDITPSLIAGHLNFAPSSRFQISTKPYTNLSEKASSLLPALPGLPFSSP